jgi:sulfite reductase alpha subunit-like flavoprotein
MLISVTTVATESCECDMFSFLFQTDGRNACIFIISTYTDGTPPDGATWFYKWLGEEVSDFRVQKTELKGMNYAVVALGNSLYKENFCMVSYLFIFSVLFRVKISSWQQLSN